MRYAVFWNSGEGFAARPLAYALKAFNLASHGRLEPARLASNPRSLNLRTYAVLTRDNALYLALINKEHGSGGGEAAVNLTPGKRFVRGEVMFLTALRPAIPRPDLE